MTRLIISLFFLMSLSFAGSSQSLSTNRKTVADSDFIIKHPSDVLSFYYNGNYDNDNYEKAHYILLYILKNISLFAHLSSIELCNVSIDSIPDEFQRRNHIKHIRLYNISINYNIKYLFSNYLEYLDVTIFDNTTLDSIPFEVLNKLRYLYLIDSRRTKGKNDLKIPEAIFSISALERLTINGFWTEKLSKNIGNLHRLRMLDLQGVSIKALPSEIGQLKHLKELNLIGTLVTEIPKSFFQIRTLKLEVSVSCTKGPCFYYLDLFNLSNNKPVGWKILAWPSIY